MNYLFAQLPAATPAQISAWLISFAAVLVIAERAFAFWKNHLREQPIPSQTYATFAGCNTKHAQTQEQIDKLAAKMQQQEQYNRERRAAIYEEFRKMREEMGEMVSRIYDEIKPLRESMSALRESDEHGKERLRTIENDIKTLLRRTP
jgi:septation ring formation regulator EzrA